ncbi:MAG TPA: protein kinase [Gemmataceae bacterium]|jgi:photosystem II stability/assembly factor-like uncharacterized protein|nr:protein kinase [Gemmataceae bacterium]
MPLRFVCPHGHRWQSVTEVAPVCPECGAASSVDTTVGGAAVGRTDELPPPPGGPGDTVPTLSPRPAPTDSPGGARWPSVPGFEVLGELGQGGMGLVYRARQVNLNREVALKRVLSGAHARAEETARFRREAEAVARLQHPNIVHVYDIVEADGCLYCSLEFVEGGSLDKKLAGRPLPPGEAAELVEVLARAMQHAHQRGIVHRDLKPANVLLTADGTPKITDFGLAKRLDQATQQTPDGAMLGTPSYMAPEQARGDVKAVGPATDVYALGVILYELLTGRRPFQAATLYEALQEVVSQAPAPPSGLNAAVPAELESICLKCLEKEPAKRYASAVELADSLRRFRLGVGPGASAAVPAPSVTGPVVVSLPSPPEAAKAPEGRWRRRLTKPVIVAIACGAVVAAALLGKWLLGPRPQPGGEGAWAVFPIGGSEAEVFDRIAFPSRAVGYAAGRQAVYKTEDSGQTWRSLWERKPPGRTHVLHFQDDRSGWLGAERLYRTEDGGGNWSEAPLPEPTRVVSGLAARDGWALAGGNTSGGDLVLFRQRGQENWQKLDPVKTGYGGDPFRRWFVGDVKITGPRVAILVLLAGYEDRGALLRTDDGGDTWKAVLTPENELYRVSFADEQRGWLTGGSSSLWRTTDGGQSWSPQATPAEVPPGSLAFAPGREMFGLAPLWQGRVLKTSDGEQWRPVEIGLGYSLPDVAVVDRGCAYVLSADGQVARYLDPSVPPAK